MSEEISREEIAALLASGSEEMTREQACDTLQNAAWLGTNEDRERIEGAVEFLCGEPCDDAISRQAVLDLINADWKYEGLEEGVSSLPSVTPKQRTGKWQEVYAETDYRNGWIEFSCENCEYQHGLESGEYGWSYGDPIPWKYCPICGARMVEPQERSE